MKWKPLLVIPCAQATRVAIETSRPDLESPLGLYEFVHAYSRAVGSVFGYGACDVSGIHDFRSCANKQGRKL